MLEHETKDCIASYPNGFFQGKEFQLRDRRKSSAAMGRFDVLLEYRAQISSKVIFPSVLRWRAYGFNLMLANCELFDPLQFSMLIDNFEAAVRSQRSAVLLADLRRWTSNHYTRPWLHQSNALLLQSAMTGSYESAAPQANAIWTYLFGSPAPAWCVWNQSESSYGFDPNSWKVWFNSLNQVKGAFAS